jgi:O-antigen ligase
MRYIIVGILFAVSIYPILSDVVREKRERDFVRERDFELGWIMINEHPVIGIGSSPDEKDMPREFKGKQKRNLGNSFISKHGYMAGGYTNGFLGVFVRYGVPLGLLLYLGFCRNVFGKNRKERLAFTILCLLSFVSEPITDTSFFFLVVFSGIILKYEYNPPEELTL